jgi:hypothetical protein
MIVYGITARARCRCFVNASMHEMCSVLCCVHCRPYERARARLCLLLAEEHVTLGSLSAARKLLLQVALVFRRCVSVCVWSGQGWGAASQQFHNTGIICLCIVQLTYCSAHVAVPVASILKAF